MPHTPGPWEFDATSDAGSFEIFGGHIESNSPMICENLSPEGDPETNKANGRLIAAAPSLLAGCRAALEMVDGNGAPPDWDWLRSIVARATAAT